MDLQLENATVLLIGPGNELDRAILRALATEGAWTYATRPSNSPADLTQHAANSTHWVATEDDVDAATVARIGRFLVERERPATALIFHINTIDALVARRPVRWWRFRSEAKTVMRSVSSALETAELTEDLALLLVYQLADETERDLATKWIDRTMSAIIKRATGRPRVNAVLIGPGEVDPDTADLVTVLCSPMASRVAGAFIPIDEGQFARAYIRYEDD